jgi:hypothetical protein
MEVEVAVQATIHQTLSTAEVMAVLAAAATPAYQAAVILEMQEQADLVVAAVAGLQLAVAAAQVQQADLAQQLLDIFHNKEK